MMFLFGYDLFDRNDIRQVFKSKSLSGLAFYILDFHLFKNYSIHELET